MNVKQILVLTAVLFLAVPDPAQAIPQFARKYGLDCSYCHSGPPRLNQRGEDFLARGYRFGAEMMMPAHRTLPVAFWNTVDLEHRASADLTKGFPSRVELISAGTIGRTPLSYFVEWRALSQQIGSGNRLLNRSGRFEDALVNVPFTRGLTLTVGQFRALGQVDVSRRLSISEPLAFSSGVAARDRAATSRLTSLRGFSPAGRQPGLRLTYQTTGDAHAADGWYSAVTLPLVGELTIPLTDAASFEFEARPKGVFAETFYRRGLSSLGGHAFLGDRRRLGHLVAMRQFGESLAVLGVVGFDRLADATRTRYSVGTEYTFTERLVAGLRVDHRTGQGRDPALLVFLNGHLPFGPPAFRQSLRLQLEQRFQATSNATLLGFSHIF